MIIEKFTPFIHENYFYKNHQPHFLGKMFEKIVKIIFLGLIDVQMKKKVKIFLCMLGRGLGLPHTNLHWVWPSNFSIPPRGLQHRQLRQTSKTF